MAGSLTYFCRGKEWNCNLENAFDADIAGTGIIASFFATALLTFVALVYGYVRGILPGVHMGSTDGMLLRSSSYSRNDRHQHLRSRDPIRQRMLEESMERFVLGLSDQQLITGLALLIACYIRCDVSLYSQGLVAASSWFSCTTHLATITVLERYFVNHTILCHIRVSCMLLVAIGVVISEVLSPDIANSYRPLAFYCAVADSTLTGFFESVFASLGTAIMSFYLIESYIKRAIALCCQPGDDGKSSWASNLRLLVGLTDGRQGITDPRPLDEGSRLPLFRLIATAISEMKHCFLNAISGMMFMGSFAVVQLITAWRAVHFDSNEESWTFGQLVPLLLLIIPMLSAGELISELRKKAAQDSDVHRCHELRSVDSVADSRHSSRTLLPGIEAAHEAISRPRITTYNPSSASTTWRSDGLLPTAKCSTSRGTETNLALYEQIRFRVVLYMLMISWPTASILAGAILAGWRAPGNDVLVIILGIYIVILRPLTNVIRFCTLRRGRSRRKRMDGLLRMVPGILAWRKRARETTREHREHDG